MKHDYKVLNNMKCACGCGRFLKQNLIDRNPDAEYIYKHYPHSKKNRENANPRKLRVQNVERRIEN